MYSLFRVFVYFSLIFCFFFTVSAFIFCLVYIFRFCSFCIYYRIVFLSILDHFFQTEKPKNLIFYELFIKNIFIFVFSFLSIFWMFFLPNCSVVLFSTLPFLTLFWFFFLSVFHLFLYLKNVFVLFFTPYFLKIFVFIPFISPFSHFIILYCCRCIFYLSFSLFYSYFDFSLYHFSIFLDESKTFLCYFLCFIF